MKRLLLMALTVISVGCANQKTTVEPAIPVDSDIEAKIKKVMAGMSLDDKIGQMCELTIDMVMTDSLVDGRPVLDSAKLKDAIEKYRVGSILNTPMGEAQSPDVWYEIINGIQQASMKYIGIPDIYGVDQNHGTTYTTGGTIFPQEINMAASLNRQLVREGAAICAYETRACNIPWVYNPVMDLGRNPAWSRIWESFGEDPFINGA
ncbi:glycoside hydrolase family 3 N-terminal domain-containing protein, partial [uncultured Duncaniella sp.]|uniref:glycoside hydrolase family 3 N-terminal domain-containing protein n=2 Tax=uncultured Duncaniella sp. TaxID=2768039 RepID=UPI00265F69B2